MVMAGIRIEADTITGTTNPAASTGPTPSQGGASWAAAEDTALTGLTKNTTKRLRIEISNEAGASSGSVLYRLEVSQANPTTCAAGGNTWTRVDTSTHWNMVASTHFADADATQDISPGLFNENTTFKAGQLKESNDETAGIILTTTEFTELEYAIAATNSATSSGTYCFRLTDAGTATDFTYTETKYGKVTLGPDLDFGFRKSMTIDRTKVPGACQATLSNFPLLVSVTDLDLSTASGQVTDPEGDDILFRATDTATCGGTAPCTLDHEIESYNQTTGQLLAWVRVPSLNTSVAASNTVIYVYYGNGDIASSIENIDGVWDTDYVGVWHLEESPANGVAGHDESAGYPTSTDGTPLNFGVVAGSTTNATGQISGADDLDGVDDHVNAGSDGVLDDLGPMTISTWVKPDTYLASNAPTVVRKDSGSSVGRWLFGNR